MLHAGICETSHSDSQGSGSAPMDLRANPLGKHSNIPSYGAVSLSFLIL